MEDTRLKVIEAAGQNFADRGFRDTTVRDICQAAGVNLASVNYHFGDKERLYLAVVQTAHERTMAARPLPNDFDSQTAEQRLAAFIHTLLQRMIGDPETTWERRLLLREVLQPTRACEDLVESSFRPQLDVLMSILAELAAPGMNRATLQRLSFSVVGQCLFYRVAGRVARLMIGDTTSDHEFSLEVLAAHITRVSLAAAQHMGGLAEGTLVGKTEP